MCRVTIVLVLALSRPRYHPLFSPLRDDTSFG